MKDETKINAVAMIGVLLTSLALVFLMMGCVSLNLFGGRTIMNVNVNGERSDNDNNMEADSSFEDAIKDIFDTSPVVPPVVLPPSPQPTPPVDPIPPVTPPTPEPFPPSPPLEDSVLVDGVWIPRPSNPDEPLGEGTPGWREKDQALWKAKSEHGGNLVILLPMMKRPKEVIIYAVSPNHQSVSELGRTSSYTRNGKNGNRTHWRFGKPGGSYQKGGHSTHLKVYMKDGSTLWYDVKSPSSRHVMKESRHQDS